MATTEKEHRKLRTPDPERYIMEIDPDDFRFIAKVVRRCDSIIDSLMAGSPGAEYLKGQAGALTWVLSMNSATLDEDDVRRCLMARYERRKGIVHEVPAEEE